ncbi:2-dehydro-3-deoxy-6-phosphogalactonate aldolase [Stappia sp.]|uniref:2-dehydro-3-deoxy-6-phosphogalactonate aldolase n=1 Tax=Stappia sp. TaxID=1870903 RepID=UPI003A99F42A
MTLHDALAACPLIAILRGVREDEILDVAAILYDAGFRAIEVPLNSPDPFASIERLAGAYGDKAAIGAGTVTELADCQRLADAGGRLMVAPNYAADVVEEAQRLGLATLPGVATPSEAFAALRQGVDGLKLFPADTIGMGALKAWRSVMPKDALLLPVGGVDAASIAGWRKAGADGFGIGGALYRPGIDPDTLAGTAKEFVAAAKAAFPRD